MINAPLSHVVFFFFIINIFILLFVSGFFFFFGWVLNQWEGGMYRLLNNSICYNTAIVN